MLTSSHIRLRTRCSEGAVSPIGGRLLRTFAALIVLALPIAATAGQNDNTLAMPLAVNWKFTSAHYDKNPSAPVVTEDTAFISAGNRLYAVDTKTGALKWRYPTDNILPASIHTTPSVSNGIVYFGAGDSLYALNAADGKSAWASPFRLNRSGVYTSPTLDGDNIYFAADNGRFYGVNAKTGEALGGVWSQGPKPGIDIGGDIVSDFTLSGDIIYYITADQNMHAVDLTSGIQRWATRLDMDVHNARPIVNGETIYLAASNTLSAYRTRSGIRLWTIPLPNEAVVPDAVDADGNSYVVTADGYIYSVNTRGRSNWKPAQSPHLDSDVIAPPLLAGNLLIVGTATGGIYAFDMTTGALKWNYASLPSSTDPEAVPTSVSVAAKPVLQGDTLYVLTDDGTLTSFRHDAPDSLPPDITIYEPAQGDHLTGTAPFYITARIVDEGSGLDLDSMRLKLDGTAIARQPYSQDLLLSDRTGYIFNPTDNSIFYATQQSAEGGTLAALPDGWHSATLSVKDWMGNEAVKTWTFFVDNSLPRRARKTNIGGTTKPKSGGGKGGKGGTGGNGGDSGAPGGIG